MSKNKVFAGLVLISALINPLLTVEAERQSLASIALQAESFLSSYPFETPYPATFSLTRLDQRLNLKPCADPLSIAFTNKDKTRGNSSLTIRCASPVSWQIHLPVKITLYDDVIVSKIPLTKGQLIDASRLRFQKTDITRLNKGYFRSLEPLQELQAKRNLPAGSILNSSNLSPRLMVRSGQRVTIMLDIAGLKIRTDGLALQSASRGQVVKVRNIQSNRVVEGVVASQGLVSVRL